MFDSIVTLWTSVAIDKGISDTFKTVKNKVSKMQKTGHHLTRKYVHTW